MDTRLGLQLPKLTHDTASPTAVDCRKWASAARAVASAIADTTYAATFLDMAAAWAELARKAEQAGKSHAQLMTTAYVPLTPEMRRRLH